MNYYAFAGSVVLFLLSGAGAWYFVLDLSLGKLSPLSWACLFNAVQSAAVGVLLQC